MPILLGLFVAALGVTMIVAGMTHSGDKLFTALTGKQHAAGQITGTPSLATGGTSSSRSAPSYRPGAATDSQGNPQA